MRVASPLDRLPWDLAQGQFGDRGAQFLAVMAKTLSRSAPPTAAAVTAERTIDPRADSVAVQVDLPR